MNLVENALERMRQRYGIFVYGYVVMPEHVHLLVSEPENGILARAIQAIKLSVSVRRCEQLSPRLKSETWGTPALG